MYLKGVHFQSFQGFSELSLIGSFRQHTFKTAINVTFNSKNELL